MRKTPNSRQEQVDVSGSSTFGIVEKISAAKTINMFMTDGWLFNTAGYQKLLTINPVGPGRGFFVSTRGNFMVAVIASTVVVIDQNFTVTTVGNINTINGEVFIDENLNSQIGIVDGTNLWILSYVGNVYTLTIQAVDARLIPNFICFINTQFMIGNASKGVNGSLFFSYIFNTATTVQLATPGAFTFQNKPDYALAVEAIPGQGSNILVLGANGGEVWTNIGGLQNWRRTNTINCDYGVASISTIAKSDKFIVFLGINQSNPPVIMIYTGQGFERISTDGIDNQLAQVKFPAQSTAMMVRSSGNGHLRYQLTFTNLADNFTIIYDFNTQKFFHLTDFALNFHPARDYVFFNNRKFFISLLNGSIYESGVNFYTYNENLESNPNPDPALNFEIPRDRICTTIRSLNSEQFRPNSFVFTIEQGMDPNSSGISILGNEDLLITEDAFSPPDDIIYTEYGIPMADEDSGAGIGAGDLPIPYRPRVDMSISRDGGYTWSNWVGRYLNPVGNPQNILNWENMGMCNSLTIRLRFWGLYRFVAFDGVVDIY